MLTALIAELGASSREAKRSAQVQAAFDGVVVREDVLVREYASAIGFPVRTDVSVEAA